MNKTKVGALGLRAIGAAAALATLGGCAMVGSNREASGAARQGVAYMLPKALLPIELVETDKVLMLRVHPPVSVGDPAQRYFLSHAHNAFASDDVTISVDPLTGMLSNVTATADDNTLAVLSEVFKAGATPRAEAGNGPSAETLLFSGLLDPDGQEGPESPNSRLLEGLQQALLQRVRLDQAACATTPAAANCQLAQRLQRALAPGSRLTDAAVVVRATPLAAVPAAEVASAPRAAPTAAVAAPAPAADCSSGVCYRSLRPFVVELAIHGVYAQSTVVMLPNGGAPVALPLDRAPFVKTEYTVQFMGGQLQSMHSKRPSSALALVKWPLEIYQAVLQATSTLIQLRIGANSKEVELAQSQLTNEKELKRLRDELQKVRMEGGSPPQGGAVLGGPQRGAALLAIELGERPVVARLLPQQQPGAASAPGTLPGNPQ